MTAIDRHAAYRAARLPAVRPSRALGGRFVTLIVAAWCVSALTGCRQAPKQGPDPANENEARTMDDFQERVKGYVAIHKRVEGELPSLPKEATPEQIDNHQRELGRQLIEARAGAKPGDLMTPPMQALVKRHLARVFGGKDGAAIKASVMDENPVGIRISVNGRYPDEVPMSTMPPEVLQILPKMPEELEYRFVGTSLVIVDVHAHLIADLIPDAMPG